MRWAERSCAVGRMAQVPRQRFALFCVAVSAAFTATEQNENLPRQRVRYEYGVSTEGPGIYPGIRTWCLVARL